MALTIGDRVRERRVALGLKQTDIDRLTFTSETRCNKLEANYSLYPRDTDRLAEVLGVSESWLLWGVAAAPELDELELLDIVDALAWMSPDERSVMRSLVDSALGDQRHREASRIR